MEARMANLSPHLSVVIFLTSCNLEAAGLRPKLPSAAIDGAWPNFMTALVSHLLSSPEGRRAFSK